MLLTSNVRPLYTGRYKNSVLMSRDVFRHPPGPLKTSEEAKYTLKRQNYCIKLVHSSSITYGTLHKKAAYANTKWR